MKTYKNNIGCKMSFDNDISDEQIQKRLNLFGGEWRLVENERTQRY